MLIVAVLLLAVVTGWAAGGSMRNLLGLPLRHEGLVLAAFLVRAVLFVTTVQGLVFPVSWVWAAQALSYGLLLWAIWGNRHIAGISLVGLGVMANAVAILVNQGRMPVSEAAAVAVGDARAILFLREQGSNLHQVMDPSTRLPFLGDVWIPPAWSPVQQVFSLGDAAILLGLFFVIFRGTMGSTDRRTLESPTL